MSSNENGPKLYTNKPKKAQIKQPQQHNANTATSTASSSAGASEASQMGSQPPPQPPKESFARRYKFLWPLVLTVNLGVGAYVLMRTTKKHTDAEEEVVKDVPSGSSSTVPAKTAGVTEQPLPPQHVIVPVKPQEPIPEDQQREIFKWILEEKRKIKPKDPEEKKRIDEEKAILKQFIRAKSIPSI